MCTHGNIVSAKTNIKTEKMAKDLEEALDIAGAGKYQLFHCALMLATLSSSLLEMIGYSFILPGAACDLDIPYGLMGLLVSIPNIGIITTAPIWGRAADLLGRKPTLLLSTAATGIFGLAAAFMPNLISFATCKLAGALFMACPTSLGYAYAGEMMPQGRRDLAVLMINGFLTLFSASTPLLAWAILSSDWHYQVGYLHLRPWRLLTAVYAAPLLVVAACMTRALESPKFLMARGKHHDALRVLRHIYARNTGLSPDSYSVTSLNKSLGDCDDERLRLNDSEVTPAVEAKRQSALALLRPPHLKWFALTGFLMFGLYTLLNGLFLLAPDTINKILRESSDQKGTLCTIMQQTNNQTEVDSKCVDTITNNTFIVTAGCTLVYGVVVVLGSASPVSKRTLLVIMYITTGTACLLAGVLTNRIAAAVLLSALQLTAIGIGSLTAYAVQLFPTSLRGTAVGGILMLGRVGSVTGANVSSYLLATSCSATFYVFTALIFLCAILSFLLPKNQVVQSKTVMNNSENDGSPL